MFLNIVTIISAFTAIVSIFYLAKQVKISYEEFKLNREQQRLNIRWQKSMISYEYMKRYNSPEFREIMATSITYLRGEEESNKEKWLKLKEDINLRSKVVQSLNFFEEMGVIYNKNLLDKELIRKYFKTIAKDFFVYASAYIQKRRENPVDSENYMSWEMMIKDF